jgi:hypothetical protein
MPIAMMDKATPTSRARKPGTLQAKNLNDLSSFQRKKKMQGKPEGDVECYYYRDSREWDSCEMQI